ncbi:MAG: hypothetical protein NTW21_20615 [Verrucomicrobia bacterium]|nr:hypothetical protein [Verrucomicrobiota bacterium]
MSKPSQFSRRDFLQTAAATVALPWWWGASSACGVPGASPPVTLRSGHRAEVKPHRGRTALFVDGKPISGMSYYGHGSEQVRRDIADTGMPVFFLSAGPLWNGPGDYDCSPFESAAKLLGDKVQNCWLMARLNCIGTPGWWADQHPDEITRYAHAPDQPGESFPDWRNPRQASMASQQWIADVGDMLRALVARVENSPYAERVLGYMINTGGSEEWVYWGAQLGLIPDYSPPALRYFKDWLRQQYGQQAWIEQVRIPLEAARRRGQPGMVRDPAKDRLAIDYELCLSAIVADCLLAWCSVVKQATGRQRITGAFSSYLMWQTGLVNAATTNGHLGLRRLLNSPDLDFVTGITSYDNREAGGPGSFMLPVESMQRAGKFFFNESDIRTHLLKDYSAIRYTSTGLLGLHPTKDAAESVDVLRREFAHHLIHGSGWWYFDMTGGWFDGPELLAEFKKQAAIAREALAWDMTSVAEVACLVSGAAPAYHPLWRMHDVNNYPPLLELQCDRATRELYRCGMPLDWLMTEDLEQDMERYKALFFYNATWLSRPQREAVEALKCGGRAMIFVGYPGLATNDKLDAQAASRLVGMKFKLDERRANAEITPRTYDDPALREVKGKLVLGPGAVVGPRLVPDDADAVVLAYWPDGVPAAAVKRTADFTSYYFPVVPNHPDLFRTMCRDAGCFAYSTNNDILFANRSLLALHFVDCIQPITLPKAHKVTNLFTGETILENGVRFMPRGDGGTHLYRLEQPLSP